MKKILDPEAVEAVFKTIFARGGKLKENLKIDETLPTEYCFSR